MPHGTLYRRYVPTSPIPASSPCQRPFSRTSLAIPASSPCQRPFSRTGLSISISSPYQKPFSRTGLAVPASGSQKTMLTDLSDHSFVQRDTGPAQLFAATQVFRHKTLCRRCEKSWSSRKRMLGRLETQSRNLSIVSVASLPNI